MSKTKTHFGFQQIDSDDKTDKVREVFDNVVEGYDLMNDLMSLGVHRIWKRVAAVSYTHLTLPTILLV